MFVCVSPGVRACVRVREGGRGDGVRADKGSIGKEGRRDSLPGRKIRAERSGLEIPRVVVQSKKTFPF